MKINIAASHRFHLLDLARELEKQGHDVRFYSYVPKSRCVKFGLSRKASKSLLLLVAPFFALQKLFPKSTSIIKYRNLLLDFYVANFTRNCDVFIGLGIVYYKSFLSFKKRKAKTILEWGSKHILTQQDILSKIDSKLNNPEINERATNAYEVVDRIAIPSSHVFKSFIDNNIEKTKLLVNPYGVDLSMFYPTKLTIPSYDLIAVGGWSLRKGCDVLVKICKQYNYSLLHVGSIVDLDFPSDSNFVHVDSVNQNELVNYYSKAKVFILLSREEGLAMVQLQALACGLPIVCSKDTGGRDLLSSLDNQKWIQEVSDLEDYQSVNRSIQNALIISKELMGFRKYVNLENLKNNYSWEAYGNRYNNNLEKLI